MNQRIVTLRAALNKTQGKFASAINITQSHLSRIESGKIPVTDRTVLLICYTFNVSEQWLRTGEGEMYTRKGTKRSVIDLVKIFEELPDEAQENLIDFANFLAQKYRRK